MYESIDLSSYFLGSIYLFSKSLQFINTVYIENKKIPDQLIILNGFTFITTGTIIVYCYGLLTLPYLKSSKYA